MKKVSQVGLGGVCVRGPGGQAVSGCTVEAKRHQTTPPPVPMLPLPGYAM